jgi:hypothetical protein
MYGHQEMPIEMQKKKNARNHRQAARQHQQWVPELAFEQDQHGVLLPQTIFSSIAKLMVNTASFEPLAKFIRFWAVRLLGGVGPATWLVMLQFMEFA